MTETEKYLKSIDELKIEVYENMAFIHKHLLQGAYDKALAWADELGKSIKDLDNLENYPEEK